MIAIRAEDIQRDFGAYLRKVEAGETVVVTQHDRPVAEIRPIQTSSPQPRPFGLCAGEFTVPEDFDAPLPEAVLRDFEGG